MRSLKQKRNKNPMGKIGNVFYFILLALPGRIQKQKNKNKKQQQQQQQNTVDKQTKC